jgi:hypothetical protein
MTGFRPAAIGADEDFVIDKTDINGTFTNLTDFAQQYRISADPSCNLSLTNPHGCIGVDIVETNPGASVQYALAGAISQGIFFATLDGVGNILTTVYWPTSTSATEHRPMIKESPTTPGDYFICGDLGSGTYVIRVNSAGLISWSKSYKNTNIQARAIIESPYNTAGSELIVVGRSDPPSTPALATEAFFMRLNASNGNVIGTTCYSDGGNGDEWFTSIEIASSPYGGSNGFIVGGRVHSSILNNVGYKPWMIKLDSNGNALWSTLIQHAISSNPLEIYDVLERWNDVASPNHFEYYGIAQTSSGSNDYMTVWKLDSTGTPPTSPTEFSYPLGALPPSGAAYNPTQLEHIGNGSIGGDGLEAFGTSQNTNDHILVSAYYNGVEGCTTGSDWSWVQGPGISINPTIIGSAFAQNCQDFSLTLLNNSITSGFDCVWNTTAPGGSNARTALSTSIEV